MDQLLKTDSFESAKAISMATKTIYRMAPAKARVGVDTRKRVNSVVPRGAFRGDNLSVEKITSLGHSAVINWNTDSRSWGDIMMNYTPTQVEVTQKEIVELDAQFKLYCDMVAEPWKYGDGIEEWIALDTKLRNSRKAWRVESFWSEKAEQEARELAESQAVWRKAFTPIAAECAYRAARQGIWKDIHRIQISVNNYANFCKEVHTERAKCCYCSASCDSNFCNVECRVLFDRECW